MNENLATLILCALQEFNSIVENACDILVHVIFQMITLILDALVLKVVFTVISRTVDDVGDSSLTELLLVAGYKVTAQVQEVIQNF